MKRIKYILFAVTFAAISLSNSILFAQRNTSVEKDFTLRAGETLEALIKGDFGKLQVTSSREERKGSVYVDYDYELFDYDYYFDEKFNELFVTLKKEKLFEGLDDLDDKDAFIDIFLPEKTPTKLDITFKGGEIDLELGDLMLQNFILDAWAGESTISFDRPNEETMEYMKIDVNIGDVTLDRLGNANFKDAYVDGGIGSLKVDMTGKYSIGDHYVEIDMDIGETEVWLPDDIGLRIHVSKWPLVSSLSVDRDLIKKGKYYYSKNYDTADTRLLVRLKMGMGECDVRLR